MSGFSACGFLSNWVRGQEVVLVRRAQVVESDLCAFCYGDVRVFPPLATDGTEIRIHQLHDLSQL